MRHEHLTNWTSHHWGRPPPAALQFWQEAGVHTPLPRDTRLTAERAASAADTTPAPTSRYRSILVPVDGGPFGEHALPHALAIARRAGAQVRVAHVHSPLQSTTRPETLHYDMQMDAALMRRQQKYLDGLSRRLEEAADVPVTPVLRRQQSVADALCEAAAGADLVVMATHGRGPLGRLWFGGVADALMRRLSVPLLLVRGRNTPADLAGEPPVRHVLIPLDGSERSERVLRPAVGLGTLMGANHTLLRVLPGGPDYPLVYGGDLAQRRLTARREVEAWEYLYEVTKRLGCRSARIRTQAIFSDLAPARAVLHYAANQGVDLIALATRGRGGLARLFRGSVAGRVAREASVPVLVYRPGAEQGKRTS